MASSGFQLYKLQVLLPDDGGRPPKHVGGNIIRSPCVFYMLYVLAVGF